MRYRRYYTTIPKKTQCFFLDFPKEKHYNIYVLAIIILFLFYYKLKNGTLKGYINAF